MGDYEVARRAGAEVIHSVRSGSTGEQEITGRPKAYLCDVEFPEQIAALADQVAADYGTLDGIVHSIAFANAPKPSPSTPPCVRTSFKPLRSLLSPCPSGQFKSQLDHEASVVSIGISSTDVTAGYGYMAPIKAALETSSYNLAKSFSVDTRVLPTRSMPVRSKQCFRWYPGLH